MAASTSKADAINQVSACVRAMQRPTLWMKRTGSVYICTSVGTLVVASLVEGFLGHPIDKALPMLCVQPLVVPVLVALGWYGWEAERVKKAFRALRDIYRPGSDPRQIASPSEIGALLTATMVEATQLGIWDEKNIASMTLLLIALMRSIRPEDGVVLSTEERKRFYEVVLPKNGFNTAGVAGKYTVVFGNLCGKLRPSVVGALATLGDSSSVPVLAKFADRTKNTELRASALYSIEQIRERARSGPEQMLRAAETPANPETLLRPTINEDTNTPSQELLRPNDSRK